MSKRIICGCGWPVIALGADECARCWQRRGLAEQNPVTLAAEVRNGDRANGVPLVWADRGRLLSDCLGRAGTQDVGAVFTVPPRGCPTLRPA